MKLSTELVPDLDKILNKSYFLNFIQSKGFSIKTVPSNLDQVFSYYKKCINDTFSSNVIMLKGETFTQEFFLDENNNYFINWCIPTAKKLIKCNKLKPVQLNLDNIINQVENKRSEEHTSELQSRFDLVCRLLL